MTGQEKDWRPSNPAGAVCVLQQPMPDDPLALVQKLRGQAQRARRLAAGISDERAIDALNQFAGELDEEAVQLEVAIKAERSNRPTTR